MRNRATQLVSVEQAFRTFAHETTLLNLAAGARERARRGRVTPAQRTAALRTTRPGR